MRIHVHQEALALDCTQALIALANGARPLEDTLCTMCKLVADVARVEVVSVYLREPRASGDALVLRGNVGFPPTAVGRVELKLFDGLTGVVAERRRPVSVAIAQHDRRYKHVDGIGEERFPAFLGVPLVGGSEVLGVLVLQRTRPFRFTTADVSLASSLTAAFIFAIQRRAMPADGSTTGASPSFAGASIVDGTALGPAVVVPSDASTLSWPAALQALELDLVAALHRLRYTRSIEIARALDNLTLVTHALREHAGDPDVMAALERVPFRTASSSKALGALLDHRRAELVGLATFLACDAPITGSVLVVPRLTTFVALAAVARGAVALLSAEPIAPDATEILRAASLPALVEPDVVARVAGGELVEIDAAHGRVRIASR